MSQKKIRVAIGLIYTNGKILVGWRDEKLHQGGCYEFPGGKVESHETPEQAVIRELKEETGLNVHNVRLFDEQIFEYPDRTVHLYFYLCKPTQTLEQSIQAWSWIGLEHIQNFSFPAANTPILTRLAWSKYLAIATQESKNFKHNINLCYLKQSFTTVTALKNQILVFTEQNIHVILNIKNYQLLDEQSQSKIFAVHLNGQQLYDKTITDHLPKFKNIIVACHHIQDIQYAYDLGCNAILLSPVHETPTHEGQKGLGWSSFMELAKQIDVPIYALGGVKMADLSIAEQHGAFGVAGIRDFQEEGLI